MIKIKFHGCQDFCDEAELPTVPQIGSYILFKEKTFLRVSSVTFEPDSEVVNVGLTTE
jgi:hypothetical protein